ncbi:MAG: DUF3429 domain-containing protein [Burkholderiaceae bacterium]|nr:DUF3429 domain-containing protein [Burkholderiaceae bacterium]
MNKHFLNKRLTHQLGFAGLVPFILLALACWLANTDWIEVFLNAQQVYAIVTLSFLGGIHWGATLISGDLSAEQTRRALGWSVVPVLVACFATVCGGFRFAVLMLGFIGSYQVDKRVSAWYKAPAWFIRLRFNLTCVVVVALLLTVFAANLRGN